MEGRAVTDIFAKVRRLSTQLQYARKTLRREKKRLKTQRRRVSRALRAQSIIQLVAQDIQQKAHKQIATIVSRCLTAVFDDPYQFKIRFERKRGKTAAKLKFVRGDLELDPIDGCGGGVIDVASFALRLACLILQQPKRRRVMILDEPFKFLSERREYRQKVRLLLEALAEEMEVQFVIVTHDQTLECGLVHEI